MSFKVGDRVQRPAGHPLHGTVRVVCEVGACGWFNYTGATWDEHKGGDYSKGGGCGPDYWELVEPAKSMSRSTDPATSKGTRKVNKYEQAVLTALAGANLNGKEIAEVTGHPLNCITPRFAPLRRAGKIKDSGVKRDKQIVWQIVK